MQFLWETVLFLKICKEIMFAFISLIFIPSLTVVAGYYDFTLVVHVSVCLSIHPFIHPSICRMSVFLFLYNNLSKYQWIFAKLGMYIDIVEIWFWIANGQILSSFDSIICQRHAVFSFPNNHLSKC